MHAQKPLKAAPNERGLRRLEEKGLIVREGLMLYAAETATFALKNVNSRAEEMEHSP
jgi:hypothetical protein